MPGSSFSRDQPANYSSPFTKGPRDFWTATFTKTSPPWPTGASGKRHGCLPSRAYLTDILFRGLDLKTRRICSQLAPQSPPKSPPMAGSS